MMKDYNVRYVAQWYVAEQQPDLQVGWITVDEPGYVRRLRWLSMHRRRNLRRLSTIWVAVRYVLAD